MLMPFAPADIEGMLCDTIDFDDISALGAPAANYGVRFVESTGGQDQPAQ